MSTGVLGMGTKHWNSYLFFRKKKSCAGLIFASWLLWWLHKPHTLTPSCFMLTSYKECAVSWIKEVSLTCGCQGPPLSLFTYRTLMDRDSGASSNWILHQVLTKPPLLNGLSSLKIYWPKLQVGDTVHSSKQQKSTPILRMRIPQSVYWWDSQPRPE